MTAAIQALRMADKQKNQPQHNLDVGDRVKMKGDYYGEVGTITKVGTNLLGLPLVDVKLDSDPDGYQPCAYPYEVEKMDA